MAVLYKNYTATRHIKTIGIKYMAYIVSVAVFLLLLVLIIYKVRNVRKIFNSEHYNEICDWVRSVLVKHPVDQSSSEDGTVIRTSGRIILAYTSILDSGRRSIHFSVSHSSGFTSLALGNRIIYLLVQIFRENKCEANLFRTQSTVHHCVLSMDGESEWQLSSNERVVALMARYQPIPMELLTTD